MILRKSWKPACPRTTSQPAFSLLCVENGQDRAAKLTLSVHNAVDVCLDNWMVVLLFRIDGICFRFDAVKKGQRRRRHFFEVNT